MDAWGSLVALVDAPLNLPEEWMADLQFSVDIGEPAGPVFALVSSLNTAGVPIPAEVVRQIADEFPDDELLLAQLNLV